jgi:hypothetical protein
MGALARIRSHGFTVTLSGDSFEITPSSLLIDTQRAFLKTHKAEIIGELKQEQTANDKSLMACPDDDRHYCRECQNLINGRCVASHTRYKPIDTHPRRCAVFSLVK